MTTIEIAEPRSYAQFQEVEKFVGAERLYRKGTNPVWYADYHDMAEAQLVVANLEAARFRARVMYPYAK